MPDCCYTRIAYHEPDLIYPYPYHDGPSLCYIFLAIALLLLLYCWLRPRPATVDVDEIVRRVRTDLSAYELTLSNVGAVGQAAAVAEASNKAEAAIRR